MIPSSSIGRVKLNRKVPTIDRNALPKKRRSFWGANPDRTITRPTSDILSLNANVENVDQRLMEEKTSGQELSSKSIPDDGEKQSVEEKTSGLEMPGLNISNDNEKQSSRRSLDLVNASPKASFVELQHAPEEDKDTPRQAERLRKGTAKLLGLDANFNSPYKLRGRGKDPGQSIPAFGEIHERVGGPNTRSKSTSGKTSFKACQPEKIKSERVKGHRKEVSCRLEVALCIFGKDSDKIRVSKTEESTLGRSKFKVGNTFSGSRNRRDNWKEKRRDGNASLKRSEYTQPIRKAKKRQSKRFTFRGKRRSRCCSSAIACMSKSTLHRPAGSVAKSSPQACSVTQRRPTASAVRKEKTEDRGRLGIGQPSKAGWGTGKVAQVRSSRRVVGTAKKDAKSSHCMTLRRWKCERVTENWTFKVPAKKPSTERSASFCPNSKDFENHSGEDNDKRLIKSPCCTTCCELKYAPSRMYSFAKIRSNKPCKIPVKVPIEQGFTKQDPGLEHNPVVNLCDVMKASKDLADQFIDSTYVLNEKLKGKPIRCFKRDCQDLNHLGIQDGPCPSAETSQSQGICNHFGVLMIGQSDKSTGNLVNKPFPVVDLAEIFDNSSYAIETQPEKRMRLTTERIHDVAGLSEILRVPDAAIQMVCSITASTSHEENPLSNSTQLSSTVSLHNSENGNHFIFGVIDGVLSNRSPLANHVLMNGMEQIEDTGESCINEHVDTVTKDENESLDDCSCQRTTPLIAWARPSCARVYISWPFRERVSPSNKFHVSISSRSESRPSPTNTTSLLPLGVSPLYNSSVTDTPVSQRASDSCEAADSSQSEGEVGDFQACVEPLSVSETNGSLSENHSNPESLSLVVGSSMSTPIQVNLQHCDQNPEAVVLQNDQPSCSPATCHLSEAAHGKGACVEEKVETQMCEFDILSRRMLQETKSPPKRSSSSFNHSEKHASSSLPTSLSFLNSNTKSPNFNSTQDGHASPFVLAQGEHSPCESQAQNLTALLEVSAALSQGTSVDGCSSMSSDDEPMDEVYTPCAEIMCEIQDMGQSCRSSFPDQDGPPSDLLDVMKAYEQDAIVLDVIQDDPELFGQVPEEINAVPLVKDETALVSGVIQLMKVPTLKNNHKITWDDGKISATGSGDLEQQGPTKRVGRVISPVEIDENVRDLNYKDEVPISNGLVGLGFQTESDLTAQKQASSAGTQSMVCEWLWPNFEISTQGNSTSASASTGDEAWDLGLDDGPMQTNVINAWAAGSFSGVIAGNDYCKFYFSEKHVCFRKTCWFFHLPVEGDERFCMAAVKKLCSGKSPHIQRAATVFTGYYERCPPGVNFERLTLQSLLSALLSHGMVKDLISVLRVMTPYKILPPVHFLLSVFEHARVHGLRMAVPDLVDLIAKCVEAGLAFTADHFDYMQQRLELLQTPGSQMEAFLTVKYRVLKTYVAWTPEVGALAIALAEVECCKEQQNWAKLGSVFYSMCMSKSSLAELNHLSGSIAVALTIEAPAFSPLPFCQFVEAVCRRDHVGGLVKSLLGRIGVSLILRCYKSRNWTKGKELLDALNVLKVNYSTLKGLFAEESSVSRCRIISVAAEVFLESGGVESALGVLRDNEWILSSPLWQCEQADIVHRHGVMSRLAECTTQKNMFVETLEILTNLPDIQDVKGAVDTSQYNIVFHRHLKACVEKQNLTVASDLADLMLTKKIEVDKSLLRLLVHKLGKQSAWPKARVLYKSALSVGCYPQTQMNKYCRILPIPHTLSEIEMTLALEMFMVSNASEIQNPGFFPLALQIVMKGKGGTQAASKTDHHAAISRLLSAAQTASPKLVIKYATVNVSQEQVFTLDSLSAYKWLSQNLSWASKVWLVSGSNSGTSISP
ncbi:hypothetical protein GJAV_G00017630 [Gymnothorax javanicus]|nr:hypothetical protein GJAV_G00017630 [Gymnothorax javanicus]